MQYGFAGRRGQRGSVAVITGLTIAVLIGFLGLSVDLGRLFVIKAELQTGMDACALAAASQLRPGLNDDDALDRAIAYGRTPANRANFQAQGLDPAVIQFSFSDTLAGPYTAYTYQAGGATALAHSARYARCTYPLANVPVLFMRVLNAVTETTVAATAVATLAPSQTNCGFPVAVCRDSTATASQSPPWGLVPGSWVSGLGAPGGGGGGPAGCGSGTGTGNFCWIDFSPPAGGASELSALIQGQGQCDLTINNPIGQTGVVASLADAWGTRFGIYKPGAGGGNVNTAPPDFTGYSYTAANWPSQSNAYSDFVTRRTNHEPFNTSSGVSISPSTAISSAQHQQYGRDRRLVLAPIVNCSNFTTSQTVNMDAWACVLLLSPMTNPGGGAFAAKLEYLGLANQPGSPCATSGLGGGTAGPLVPVLVQ
ncbi:pilus assembly protein TadG-related protein [Burkholderiaceae bacterium FT117]|uniref:pilus assembly protein TadG-related protein n=1 Tax=Zeimonas sediminis TaxID=2944268 RepID=UPI00234314E6|nr:TadE/TadG family type IV pilus assembly protein [Zeimonas sediminis]MCM5572083.1 pilus assembly protein TadG-related protein [Zeimonas sediminis]